MLNTYLRSARSLPGMKGPERLILVIDESGSMASEDFKPTRLDAARKAALALIEAKWSQNGDDQVGVVGFSGSARTIHDPGGLREEAASVEGSLRRLRIRGATNISAGLALAARLLGSPSIGNGEGILGALCRWLVMEDSDHRVSQDEKVWASRIVLLSDGEDTSTTCPVEVAAGLKANGIVIDTVGIGGSPSDIDEDTLKEIASENPDGSKRYSFIKDTAALIRKFETLAGRLRRLEV